MPDLLITTDRERLTRRTTASEYDGYAAICVEQQRQDFEAFVIQNAPTPSQIREWWQKEMAYWIRHLATVSDLPMSSRACVARIVAANAEVTKGGA